MQHMWIKYYDGCHMHSWSGQLDLNSPAGEVVKSIPSLNITSLKVRMLLNDDTGNHYVFDPLLNLREISNFEGIRINEEYPLLIENA